MGQMSSNFGEIIKKLIPVFGEQLARGLPKPPPSSRHLNPATFTRGENAKLSRGVPKSTRQIEMLRKRKGGKILCFLNNLITKRYFDPLLLHKDVYSFSSPYFVDKLCSSPFCVPGGIKNGVLYSEGRAYKRAPELVASPQSTALHSTGNISAEDSVYKKEVCPLLFFPLN
jgi:hypothetical protein